MLEDTVKLFLCQNTERSQRNFTSSEWRRTWNFTPTPKDTGSLGFCDRASWANCEVREKTNKMQQLDIYYQHFLNMFRASLCPSSGEQRPCVTACGVLRWFCWMWLVAVVGRCVLGCEHCRTVTFTVLAPYNAAPLNRYQPHPAEPAQHTACSNTRLGLLRMGIMMPETCWESVDNKHLTVASCWFSLSLHRKFIFK